METVRISLEEYNKLIRYQETFNSIFDYNINLIKENQKLKQELDIIEHTNNILRIKNNSLLSELSKASKQSNENKPKEIDSIIIEVLKSREDNYVSIQRYV